MDSIVPETSAPLPSPQLNWALFVDFDGTLAHIAEHPEGIEVEKTLIETLDVLSRCLGGAVAVISGRPLAQIDRFLSPLTLAGAGKHGLEVRLPGDGIKTPEHPHEGLKRIKTRLAEAVAGEPRLYLEDKWHTLALHYRQIPEQEAALRRMVDAAVADEDGLQVLAGKMVLEVKPAGCNKGVAIESFMRHPVFRGRVPVFAGDDVTDEDGFRTVNALGGISVRVGPEASTAARFSVADVDAFAAWLEQSKAVLEGLARAS